MEMFVVTKKLCGDQDDMHLRVYNYNTLERVNQFEAHSDYLRSIAIHPTQPYILSSSGELTVDFVLY